MELHNSVVVSDGDDKKISLWRKTGQSTGTIPAVGTDSGGDNIENGSARWTPPCAAIIPNFHLLICSYEVKIRYSEVCKIRPHGVAIRTRKVLQRGHIMLKAVCNDTVL
ncbi:hypothetical protein Tco_0929214 [Tanacetum coccineum]